MQIVLTDSSELADHPYTEIEPGRVYHAPGRLVIIQSGPGDSAMLILTEPAQ